MKVTQIFALSGILGLISYVLADGFGVKPENPQLPGVSYVVHDGTRPQPLLVAAAWLSRRPPMQR